MNRARKVLKNETIAILGYGVQGPAQSLNLRDNGFKVIIGQAKRFQQDWDRAGKDGWVPGKTLFELEEAVQQGTIIQMLVSDAALARLDTAGLEVRRKWMFRAKGVPAEMTIYSVRRA